LIGKLIADCVDSSKSILRHVQCIVRFPKTILSIGWAPLNPPIISIPALILGVPIERVVGDEAVGEERGLLGVGGGAGDQEERQQQQQPVGGTA